MLAGHVSVVSALVEKGADKGITDLEGNTPEALAKSYGAHDTFSLTRVLALTQSSRLSLSRSRRGGEGATRVNDGSMSKWLLRMRLLQPSQAMPAKG